MVIIDSGCRGFIGPCPSAPLDEWVMQLSGYRSAPIGQLGLLTNHPGTVGQSAMVMVEMVTGWAGAPSLPPVAVPFAAMPVSTSNPSVMVPKTV